MFRRILLSFLLLLALSLASRAGSYLFYGEIQGIGGYSSAEHKGILHSGMKHDSMQKNSVGFDFIKTHSFLSLSLQFRLAYDDNKKHLQPQIYNAYAKLSLPVGRVWLGHNRPAFGLNSYWDLHADLLGGLTMYGIGQELDWGLGYEKDTSWGDIRTALTLGSSMDARTQGNWAWSGRISYGILNQQNWNTGLSVWAGKPLEMMGYHVVNTHTQNTFLVGWDGALNCLNTEQKAQISVGKLYGEHTTSLLYRMTLGLDSEQRWQAALQSIIFHLPSQTQFIFGPQLSYQASQTVTLSSAYQSNTHTNDHRVLGQIYIYFLI